MRVEQREVGHDDRNRKRYRQHAGERAQRPDEHAEVCLGSHVAVAHGRHGYNRPPQSDRDEMDVFRDHPGRSMTSFGMKWTFSETTQDADVFGNEMDLLRDHPGR